MARSTKTTNESTARKIAFEWEGAGATLAVESSTGAQVDKVIRQVWERLSGKRMEHTPARDFIASWSSRMKSTRSAHTAERYQTVLAGFIDSLGERADLDLRAISVADVQKFIDGESRVGKRGSTVTIAAKVLRAVFNSAIRAGALERNPAGVLDLPDAVQEEREPFTEQEFEDLLRVTKGTEWETAIMLGGYTGLRLGDVVGLKWDSVSFTPPILSVLPTKTARKKKRLLIPLVPRLSTHLEALASKEEAQQATFVMPGLAGRSIGGRAGLSREFKLKMKAANIEAGDIASAARTQRQLTRKSFHSLRHSCASFLVNAGVQEDVRRMVLGHADAKTTQRYSHLQMETIRSALEKLPSAKRTTK